jgi:hypothetical protein
MKDTRDLVGPSESRYDEVSWYRRRVYATAGAVGAQARTPIRTETLLGRRYTSVRPSAEAQSRRVLPRETLFSIAQDVYGDSRYWYWILDNNATIADPFDLPEGLMLKLSPPPLRAAARELR